MESLNESPSARAPVCAKDRMGEVSHELYSRCGHGLLKRSEVVLHYWAKVLDRYREWRVQ